MPNPISISQAAASAVDPATSAVLSREQKKAIEKQAFRDGVRISAGTMPGIFAWGLVSGMAMIKAGLTVWQALGMTLLVFAGSAQLAALPLIAAHTPALVIFATALVVNLRFVIFSAAIGPHFTHLGWVRRIGYGYLSSDMLMAFFPQRFPYSTLGQPLGKAGFFQGISAPNWLAWQGGAITGLLLAGQIPESWQVGFAGTLALLGVMIPLTINLAALAGVLVSAAVAVLAIGLPFRLGLLLAVVLGMAAAMLADRFYGDQELPQGPPVDPT
ncbi:MAG: AzlC family ABC transporter permease [Herminiimonas sp.]|nr:AzlC family ABC transporter permease [Herminiimonas sp.]